MRISGEAAVLEILPFEKVLLHEKCDEGRVEKLVRRFLQDKVLRNPLIVARAEAEDQYITLDGANRYCALSRLNCRHLLAQVVDYSAPGLELHAWYHVLPGADKRDLLGELEGIKGAKFSKIEPARAMALLEKELSCCALFCPPREVFLIEWEPQGLALVEVLNRIIETYEKRFVIVRINADQLNDIMARYSSNDYIVVGYPRLSPKEICQIAINGQKLPAGITKHVIPKRILRVNFPLDILKADMPLEEKNRILERIVEERQRSGSVRHYSEPVIVFDE